MKNCLLLSVAFFVQISCFGQTEFAPIGASWNYRFLGGWVGFGAAKFTCEKDTLIAGKTCKKLVGLTVTDCCTNNDNLFIHQSADSIFIVFTSTPVQIYFLFRNELEVGEYVRFPYLHANLEYLTEAVDTLTFNGEQVKRCKLKETGSNGMIVHIYDKFGPEFGFFAHWLGSPFDGNDYYLRCYRDDDFEQINLSNEDCDEGLLPSTEAFDVASFNVFPNPSATDMLNIDLPENWAADFTLILSDASGKMVMKERRKASERQLETGSMPPGFYFGKVEAGGRAFYLKFLKN